MRESGNNKREIRLIIYFNLYFALLRMPLESEQQERITVTGRASCDARPK